MSLCNTDKSKKYQPFLSFSSSEIIAGDRTFIEALIDKFGVGEVEAIALADSLWSGAFACQYLILDGENRTKLVRFDATQF